jgi:regulator of protease activity HflC (stomatin/prohibitin superfamily)
LERRRSKRDLRRARRKGSRDRHPGLELAVNPIRQENEMFELPTIVIIIVALYLFSSIKILAEYERGVIFRLGRLLPEPKGPGLILVFAPLDRIVRISLRVDTIEVPPQDVVTKDNVTVKVNAVIFFRVIEPRLAVVEVNNFLYATSSSRRRRCAACWEKPSSMSC